MDDRSGFRERALGGLRSATDAITPTAALSDEVMTSAEAIAMADDAASDGVLSRLASATQKLSFGHEPAADDFTDALMRRLEAVALAPSTRGIDAEARVTLAIDRLARSTSVLEPAGGLTDAVMAALGDVGRSTAHEGAPVSVAPGSGGVIRGAFPDGMMRWARASLVAASFAAAASVALSWYSERTLDKEVIAASDPLEVGE